MWKLWKWDGRYIQGELISKHTSESAAIKKAAKEINFKKQTKEIKKGEIVIWLDDEDGTPMGVIIKATKGTKRIRQSKEEK